MARAWSYRLGLECCRISSQLQGGSDERMASVMHAFHQRVSVQRKRAREQLARPLLGLDVEPVHHGGNERAAIWRQDQDDTLICDDLGQPARDRLEQALRFVSGRREVTRCIGENAQPSSHLRRSLCLG